MLCYAFFWSVPMEWNKIDLSLREIGDIKIFKSKLGRHLHSPSMLVPSYNKTTGEGSIHHARMIMGLNSHNAHRCKYFIPSGRCLLCQQRPGDTTHFLSHFPALATPVSLAPTCMQIHPAFRTMYQYPHEFPTFYFFWFSSFG